MSRYGPRAGKAPTGAKYVRGGRSSGGKWGLPIIAAGGLLAGGAAGLLPSWSSVAGSVKSGIVGGIRSGLSKRIDAQLAGSKGGLYGTPAGALQYADHAQQGEWMAANHTQQAESQGQWLGFQADQAALNRAHQSQENARDRALTLMLYGNGQRSDGQMPGEPVPGSYSGSYGGEIPWYFQKSQDRLKQRRSRWYRKGAPHTGDIGTTWTGRHYGSTW